MSINEADTCRKYVLPKLKPWEQVPHLITEQYPIDAGRILTTGGRDRRRKKKYIDALKRLQAETEAELMRFASNLRQAFKGEL